MGCISTKPAYIDSASGGEKDYHAHFMESKTLGQGEFGVVKLVHDVRQKDLVKAKPYACKYLKKGFTFKDGTIYTPMKKNVLEGEVEILRRLDGQHYTLKLVQVYESPSTIYVITELCEGGEMMPWVSTAFKDTAGLRSDDVSRVAFQLFSAVDHCKKHKVIHRDIKPENVMFCNAKQDSELRLIDFGSGKLDGLDGNPQDSTDDTERHHTFAGSAFYISPEMFQKNYTCKTDVWSAGATLYVLVAGYPDERLQTVFNLLQSSKPERVKTLPNMPDNMPDSFYDMLEGALAYRHKARSDAGDLAQSEFAQFHLTSAQHGDTVSEMAHESKPGRGPGSVRRTTSVILEGSVKRHDAHLGYQKFERSLTTVLATMLSKESCRNLLAYLDQMNKKNDAAADTGSVDSGSEKKEPELVDLTAAKGKDKNNTEKLQVVTIKELMDVLSTMGMDDEREREDAINMIKGLKGYIFYDAHAYHISLLRQFINKETRKNQNRPGLTDAAKMNMSVHGSNVFKSMTKKSKGFDGSGHNGSAFDPDGSTKSMSNFRSMRF